ncbi:hypothetical protein [Pseudoalteromonas ostreae]|uniref:hypothetical protein n=1 Tax=Pseudoalteromonas ostreae TaxID=2774154 RepID=UPI001B36EEF3|nr:hypothetical protein [Pseudoalteromonas ostreae]
MHNYDTAETEDLIHEHLERTQLYSQAKTKTDSQTKHSEYQLKHHLHEQFTHVVLPHLDQVKVLLAEHDFAVEVDILKEQLSEQQAVSEVIYQVVFKFSGISQSDTPLNESTNNNQLVIFTQANNHFLMCRYKTNLVVSQSQPLFVFDDDQGASNNLRRCANRWHECTTDFSELTSVVQDFISLVFIQKRTNLSRI